MGRTSHRHQLHGLARVRRNWLRAFLPAALAVVLLAGASMAALEADTAHSFGAGVLWALSLMMTVGFTGGAPHTVAGKVLAGFLMVLGFGLLALTTASIASLFVREDEMPEEQRELGFERDAMSQLAAVAARLDRIERHLTDAAPSSRDAPATEAPPGSG
jgi:voltage-gated potassium channel